jgi:hypothetical protein
VKGRRRSVETLVQYCTRRSCRGARGLLRPCCAGPRAAPRARQPRGQALYHRCAQCRDRSRGALGRREHGGASHHRICAGRRRGARSARVDAAIDLREGGEWEGTGRNVKY